MFNRHYSELSSRDHGTLYQMKIRLGKIGKGVKKSVKDAVNNCGEFLRITTKIYIILAAMKELNLSDPVSSPAGNSLKTKKERETFFDSFALSIVDKFVLDGDYDPEKIIQKQPEPNLQQNSTRDSPRIICGYPECPKTFALDGLVRQRHREVCIYKDLILLENETPTGLVLTGSSSNTPVSHSLLSLK